MYIGKELKFAMQSVAEINKSKVSVLGSCAFLFWPQANHEYPT